MKPWTRTATLAALLVSFAAAGCSRHWDTFRHDDLRSGNQRHRSKLSNPNKVTNLHVVWNYSPPGNQGFFSSPVVRHGKVFIGNSNGFFYALDADTGSVVWQYPPSGGQALTSTFTCNPSSWGIASTAALTKIGGTEAVIFGAPDRSSGLHLGDGHLFALDANTGALIWESPPVSQVTGSGPNDVHSQIGYSSPLVFDNRVYIGIGDHCDNPIQNGQIIAVQLATGAIDTSFNYASTSTRGGGVWSAPAALEDLYIETGNTANGNVTEPVTNHGLSMLRLNHNSGGVTWQHQPVPYSMDNDPDWAAGAAVMPTSCGALITSQEKDGWAWAVDSATGHPRWAFPTGPWATAGFMPADGTSHGDTDYKRPGAAWGDVYIATVGGLQLTSGVAPGYPRLHALNVCAPENRRIRWIKDVPDTSSGFYYALGPPTVDHGIVFVGTSEGHLVVIADPSVAPPVGYRCSNPAVPIPICSLLGSLGSVVRLVPDPAVLKDVNLPGSGGFFGEPVLVGDRVFMAGAGTNGPVFMLDAN